MANIHTCDTCHGSTGAGLFAGRFGKIWRCLNAAACERRLDWQLRVAGYWGA